MYMCSTYEEIAQELGVTRQCIAQTAKSGLRKVFVNTQKLYPDLSPREIIQELCLTFKLTGKDQEEFIRAFPADIKKLLHTTN